MWYQEGLRERRIGCTTCHRPFFLKEVEKTIERRWKRKKQEGKWEEEGGTQLDRMIRLGGSRKVGKQKDQCKLKHGERYMYEHSEVRRREEDSEQTITSYEEEEEHL